MDHFNFNGKIINNDTAIIGADNRGLKYGDGLFETIKYKNNELILIDEHLSRLWKGMQQLQFEIPKLLNPDALQQQILQLIKKNKLQGARIRLAVYRGDGGLYDTKKHSPLHIIQTWPIPAEQSTLNENGLQLCIYPEAKKTIDSFSNLKHNNYLPYFMGALFAKQQQCNDAIILNIHNRICDSTIANLFAIKNETIYTPALHEGCVAGVMRRFIIQNLELQGYKIEETTITKEFLSDAEEVFLTNSIYNMRWVATIENKHYTNTITRQIFQSFVKTNPLVFC